jgi:hypothetical protein
MKKVVEVNKRAHIIDPMLLIAFSGLLGPVGFNDFFDH